MKRMISLVLSMLIVFGLFSCLSFSAAETESADAVGIVRTVNRIELTVPEPKANNTITYKAEVPADAPYIINEKHGDSNFWSHGVCWTRVGYIGPMNCHVPFDFLQGKSYKIEIAVKPDDPLSYSFASPDQLNATVNGQEATVTDNGDGTYIVSRVFYIPITVESIDLTMPEPHAGDKVRFTASAPVTAGYTVMNSDSNLWCNGVMWLHGIDVLKPDEENYFIAGYDYSATVFVVLKDNDKYVFDDISQIKATVNGHEAQVYKISKTQYNVTYYFTAMNIISQPTATIPEPRAGDRLRWTASAPENAHYSVSSESSDFMANGVTWYKGSKVITPGKNISFEVGETYKVVVRLDAGEFSQFAEASAIHAFINDYAAVASVVSDTRCLISYTFTVTESTGIKLGDVNGDNVVDITDATLIQQYAAETIEFSEAQKKAADVNHDGNVDVSDATMVQMYVAEIIKSFD